MTISNAKKGHWGQFSRFAWWMGTHPPPGTSPEFGRLTVRLSGKAFMQIPISIASTWWGLMHVLNLGKPGKLNKETEEQTWIISHISTLGFYVFYFSHLPLISMLTVDVRWRWWLESGEVVFADHTAWVLVPLTTNMESISPTESILYLLTPHQKKEGLGKPPPKLRCFCCLQAIFSSLDLPNIPNWIALMTNCLLRTGWSHKAHGFAPSLSRCPEGLQTGWIFQSRRHLENKMWLENGWRNRPSRNFCCCLDNVGPIFPFHALS